MKLCREGGSRKANSGQFQNEPFKPEEIDGVDVIQAYNFLQPRRKSGGMNLGRFDRDVSGKLVLIDCI